jgi:hypothetical protein
MVTTLVDLDLPLLLVEDHLTKQVEMMAVPAAVVWVTVDKVLVVLELLDKEMPAALLVPHQWVAAEVVPVLLEQLVPVDKVVLVVLD